MSRHSLMDKKVVKAMRPLPRFKVKTLSLLTGGVICAALLPPNSYAELPDPCRGGCGPQGNLSFVQSGAASYNTVNNTMTVTQTTDKAVLNWNTFNVSENAAVNFVQKNTNSVALNRVFSATPSKVLGNVSANGQIYLINPSGILFGKNAKINVGGLVASTLNVDTNTFINSGVANALEAKKGSSQVEKDDYAAFRNKDGEWGEYDTDAKVVVEKGASIKANKGGNVTLVGKSVENQGTVEANDGQVMMIAAEDRVYLQPSDDLALRGFLVEVDTGGTVTNTGEVRADRGNVTLAGHAVNQKGVVKATTSIDRNGSVYLQARDGGDVVAGSAGKKNTLTATRGGALTVGEDSLTSIELELDSLETAIDEQDHIQSQVKLSGKTVHIEKNARIVAHNGVVDVVANATPDKPFETENGQNTATRDDTAYIQVDEGVEIDVQGADATLAMESNFVTLELYSSELKDSPLQRNGILRGEEITVDIRKGTPLADISAAVAAKPKTLAERASEGGTVNLVSQGAVALHEDSTIDVSGGEITYEGGFVSTTKLTSNGRIIDISDADPSLVYDGIVGVYTRADREQGVIYRTGRPTASRYWESGYTEGRDAGEVTIGGYNMQIGAEIVSDTVAGRYQTSPDARPDGGTLNIGLPRNMGSMVDNLAPNIELASEQAQQAVDVQLADIESAYRMEVTESLRARLLEENADYTDDDLNNALREEWASVEVQTELKGRLLNAVGDDNRAVVNIGRLAASGLQNINVNSNGTITLASAGAALTLADNAALTLKADKIDIQRSISTTGGELNIRSQADIADSVSLNDESIASGISVADNVVLDTSGEYVNDFGQVQIPEGRPVTLDGGKISLSVSGGHVLGLGHHVSLLADGGALVSKDGSVEAGNGGDITLDASALEARFQFSDVITGEGSGSTASEGLVLSARGLSHNGSLTLGTGSLMISDNEQVDANGNVVASADAGGITSRNDLAGQGNRLTLTSAFLEDGAFANYKFKVSSGDAIVDRDTQIDLVQRNLVLNPGSSDTASAANLQGISTVQTLDPRLRDAVDFSITQKTDLDHDLVIATGSRITTEAGGKLSFSNGGAGSGGRILVDGELEANAGSISFALTRETQTAPVNDASMIWFGEHASVTSTGVFDEDYNRSSPGTLEGRLVTGELLDGGKLDIKSSGRIVMQEGSVFDVSAENADIDVYTGSRTADSLYYYDRKTFQGKAGSISLTSGEGMVLAGEFRADSDAVGASQSAGLLSIKSTFDDRGVTNSDNSEPSLTAPARRLVITADTASETPADFLTTVAEGLSSYFSQTGEDGVVRNVTPGSLSADTRGETVLNASQLSATFDNLQLTTDGVVSIGSAESTTPVALTVDNSIKINSQLLEVNSPDTATALLSANYVKLGSAKAPLGLGVRHNGIPDAGDGNLRVEAGTLDLQSSLTVSGVDSLALNADKDIRLIDTGTVSSSGDMTLTARHVVATTASDMTLRALDIEGGDREGHITIESNGRASVPALAAQGKVTLTAAEIDQNGVLLAPFGSISLDGRHLATDGTTVTAGAEGAVRLGAGSVTSTSLQGESTLYGTTLNGLEWIYGTNNTGVFTDNEQDIVNPAVNLNGDSVEIAEGATVDISGGGDLLAYEFIPGLGGSKDYVGITNALSDGVERYAILPRLGDASVPYDQKFSAANGAPAVGSTIVIGEGAGLPAGEYVLLPVQYALLPGAYVVEKVSGYRDVAAVGNFELLDGTPVVGGTLGIDGLDTAATRSEGFEIRPGTDVRQFSEYRETSANAFFADRAKLLDLAVAPARPADAALLSIAAGSELTLDGDIKGDAAETGRGSQLDISADSLRVVASLDDAAGTEGVVLTADQLNQLDVSSLLLGGRRTGTSTGMAIDVLADDVSVDADVRVSGAEIMLVATGSVDLNAGAALVSDTKASNDRVALSINHGGAIVATSNRRITAIERTGGESGSSATLDAGGELTSKNSVALDSTGSTLLGGTLSAPGAVHLGASHVEVGAVDNTGLVLDQNTLARLEGVDLLGIQASGQMVVANGTSVNADDLRITTPLLKGELGEGGQATLTANRITLAGGTTTAEASQGEGTLRINASTVNLASGNLAIGGVDRLRINATESLGFVGDGTTRIAASNVTVTTPVVQGSDGITASLSASGDLRFDAADSAATVAGGIGAKVDVSASTLTVNNRWAFESGVLGLTATDGDLSLGATAELDLSGREFSVYETVLQSGGGALSLQSHAGNVDVAQGARVDVSAPEKGGDAGLMSMSAAAGTVNFAGQLLAQAAQGASGSLAIDAQQLSGGLDGLSDLMQESGAHGALALRLRGSNAQSLSAGKSLAASDIDIALDNADLAVNGVVDASGKRGGNVSLSANGHVELGNGAQLLARGEQDRGGSVLVSAHGGELAFREGATIDVSGEEGGTATLRADLDAERGVNIDDDGLQGNVVGARRVSLEVRDTPYSDTGSFTSGDAAALQARALSIQASAADLRTRLELAAETDVAAALEVVADGNYVWNQEVNLDEWQVLMEDGALEEGSVAPGSLIVRATGNLTFSRSLHDGFNADGVLTDKNSWNYVLVAGADTDAANLTETVTNSSADFTVGNNVRIRTGNGDIAISSARDFTLSNAGSTVYTAGRDIGIALDRFDGLIYEVAGDKMVSGEAGQVSIVARRDIKGHAPATGLNARVQAWTDWLKDNDAVAEALVLDPETGEPLVDAETGQYLYERVAEDAGRYIDYRAFAQGVAAFGNGDVTLDAGNDVVRLDVSLPTTVNINSATGDVTEIGSGTLSVKAAGDVISSNFMIGQGVAKVEAQGNIASARAVISDSIAGYTALMGGQFQYVARKDINLLGAFDPGIAQRLFVGEEGDSRFYYTFDEDTAFSASSIAGDTTFRSAIEAPVEQLVNRDVFFPLASTLVPGKFTLASFAGDVTVNGDVRSNLVDESRFVVWGDKNVTINDTVILLDNLAENLATVANPVTGKTSFEPTIEKYVSGLTPALENADTTVSITALEGDVIAPSLFRAPVSVDVYAGHDIRALRLAATHYDESDVSHVTAIRDISLSSGTQGISIAGPGRVEVMAGRNINLGSSRGIETLGATTNSQLTGRGGADVFVLAGVKPGDVQYETFIAPLLDNASRLDLFAIEVQTYVNRVTSENLSQRDAAERFRTLSTELQEGFVSGIADNADQVKTLLSALAYADALADNISQTAGYSQVLDRLKLSEEGLAALVESFRLHEGSNAAAGDVPELLDTLTEESLQEVLHYSLALLDETTRRGIVVSSFSALSESDQRPLITQAFFNELTMSGRNANAGSPDGYDRGYEAADRFFATAEYKGDKELVSSAQGNLSLLLSKVYTIDGGDINLLVPGGFVNAGVVTPPLGGVSKPASELGIVAQAEGSVHAYLQGDFLVNQSRVFTLQEGDIAMWSSAGNIDAGRGAKTAVAAPAPTISLDANGNVVINTAGAVAGSGIRQIDTTGEDSDFEAALAERTPARSVDLIAPIGEVNAGDAGIGASGNINIAAARVIGADNIDIGGVAIGVPVADSGGFSGGLTGGDSASSAVNKASDDAGGDAESDSPNADEALSWLEMTFAGFGDDEEDERKKKGKKGNG